MARKKSVISSELPIVDTTDKNFEELEASLFPEPPTHLSQEELAQIKVANLEDQIRGLNRAIMDRDVRLLLADSEIARQKSEVVRHRLLVMKQEHSDALQSHIAWWNTIKAKFGAKENDQFGYSPESGIVTITKKGD